MMDVGSLVQVPLPDEAMAALMSLAYNCGVNVERRSLKNGEGAVDIPVEIGGALCRPGDVLFADDDGVVVIDPAILAG